MGIPPPPSGFNVSMKSKCCNANVQSSCVDMIYVPPEEIDWDKCILYFCLKCRKKCKLKTN